MPRNEKERDYILDYCHPIGPANEEITARLYQIIALNSNKLNMRLNNTSARRELDKMMAKFQHHAKVDGEPPSDIYPLY